METLRQQVQTDVEKPFREKVLQVDAELEKSRSDYKKLKYDYTFLKSEYEHESSEHKRIIDELTLRYEAEVSSLNHYRWIVWIFTHGYFFGPRTDLISLLILLLLVLWQPCNLFKNNNNHNW